MNKFKIGDCVICSGGSFTGEKGVVIEIDRHDGIFPYWVDLENYGNSCFKERELTLIEDKKETVEVPVELLKQLHHLMNFRQLTFAENEVFMHLEKLIPKPLTNEELIAQFENSVPQQTLGQHASSAFEEIKKRLRAQDEN